MQIFLKILIAGLALPLLLAGCTTGVNEGNVTNASTLKQRNSPDVRLAKLRKSGAKETTLAAFCKSPPQTQTPAGSAAIKFNCQSRILKVASDASVFDKGKGVYTVQFKRPVKRSVICGNNPSKQPLCGATYAGEMMISSSFVAR